jgi:hypothetical protein
MAVAVAVAVVAADPAGNTLNAMARKVCPPPAALMGGFLLGLQVWAFASKALSEGIRNFEANPNSSSKRMKR